MATTTLYVTIAGSNLSKADLAYIFGHYVTVVGIDYKRLFAFVDVPSHSEALYAIHELNGRFVGADRLRPLVVAFGKQNNRHQASAILTPDETLDQNRSCLDLDKYIWRFAVNKPGNDFAEILKFFRSFGAIIRWLHNESHRYGYVVVKTALHWKAILDRFDESRLAELGVTVDFNKVQHLPLPLTEEWITEGYDPAPSSYHFENFFIGTASDLCDARIRGHFKPWGEVVHFDTVWSAACGRYYRFVLLKTRYGAEEILRQMEPLVINGCTLRVESGCDWFPAKDELMVNV